MKSKPSKVRQLAIELFNVSESEKQHFPKRQWQFLSAEVMAVWFAVAKCAIKRLTCLALIAAFLFLPCQRAKAPISVGLALTLKCLTATGIGATALIIFRCEPNYYLIRVRSDYEQDHWLVSQASESTVKKNEGWLRCEGPFKGREEPDFRAWCNNRDPQNPMFPCGPLGTIPNATRTNYMRVTLQQSTDGGGSWASVASTATAYGADGSDEGWSFAMLPATGTNGFSRAQLDEVAGASCVFTNAATAAIFRTQFEETTEP